MAHLKIFAVALAAALPVAVSAVADPKSPRPDGADITECELNHPENFDCEGLLCWCCYSDGCYICNNASATNKPADCKWDPGRRLQHGVLSTLGNDGLQVAPNRNLSVQPRGTLQRP